MNEEVSPRPPRQDEFDALAFLLKGDVPGLEALREQTRCVLVTNTAEECCATIALAVDKEAASASGQFWSGELSARSKERPGRELLLFVRDGYLHELEIVHYEEERGPKTFPPPSDFRSPTCDRRVSRSAAEE